MKIALTGATGFVGSHVLTELRDHGHEVTAFVRDDAGNLIMLGTGRQHWSTVHVADLADAFRRVLEDDSAHGYYVIGNGTNSTLAELTDAAAVAVGALGAVPGSDEEARARFGDYFAEVLLLDQGTAAAKARDELGWHPTHPSLVSEFRHGSYRR
jgi:nucleoside-diphosphate-sugar epimerase